LVKRTLTVREPGGEMHDLSGVRVRGVCLSDMIAHNHERNKSVFQTAPGQGSASARLARVALEATLAWIARARANKRAAGVAAEREHAKSNADERADGERESDAA